MAPRLLLITMKTHKWLSSTISKSTTLCCFYPIRKVFPNFKIFRIFTFFPENEEKQNQERLGEYFRNFRDVAVKHERTGNGRDSLFIVSEADNAENYRLLVRFRFFENLGSFSGIFQSR